MPDQDASTELHRELLLRIAQRDLAAMGELYDALSTLLFSVAVRILGDRHDAEEAMQDVFVQIWDKADRFDPELGTPLQWVLRITRNRCIDRLRSRKRRDVLLDDLAPGPRPEWVVAEESAESESWGPEETAAVHQAVARLPEEQGQALRMAFFVGLSHQEIADRLKAPLGTVKARIRRGMLKLRELLPDPA
jgi:RNA polymerase sigma-70 factor (ECF subfamily)